MDSKYLLAFLAIAVVILIVMAANWSYWNEVIDDPVNFSKSHAESVRNISILITIICIAFIIGAFFYGYTNYWSYNNNNLRQGNYNLGYNNGLPAYNSNLNYSNQIPQNNIVIQDPIAI
jgi:Na+/proline symporter